MFIERPHDDADARRVHERLARHRGADLAGQRDGAGSAVPERHLLSYLLGLAVPHGPAGPRSATSCSSGRPGVALLARGSGGRHGQGAARESRRVTSVSPAARIFCTVRCPPFRGDACASRGTGGREGSSAVRCPGRMVRVPRKRPGPGSVRPALRGRSPRPVPGWCVPRRQRSDPAAGWREIGVCHATVPARRVRDIGKTLHPRPVGAKTDSSALVCFRLRRTFPAWPGPSEGRQSGCSNAAR